MARDDDRGFGLIDLGAGLLGGGDAGDEFREMVDELAPNASNETIERTVSSAIVGVADVRSRLAEQAAEKEDGDEPAVFLRERELNDGRVAVRVFVDDPDARLYLGDDSILLRSGNWEHEQPLGFSPGRIERQQGTGAEDTISEWIVHPEPPALEANSNIPDDLDVERIPNTSDNDEEEPDVTDGDEEGERDEGEDGA